MKTISYKQIEIKAKKIEDLKVRTAYLDGVNDGLTHAYTINKEVEKKYAKN